MCERQGSSNLRIIVHLGASGLPETFHEESLQWVRKAVERGKSVASTGATAENIVSEVVACLEDCPVSDAGCGAFYNADGDHELSAGLMTSDGRYGAICSVSGVRNPVKLARIVADMDYSIFTGSGAEAIARRAGLEFLEKDKFATRYNKWTRDSFGGDSIGVFEKPGGTVGCAVRDQYDNLAAATSTGGTPGAPRGRVGDSPFPGCGVWASTQCAVSCTGYGEKILTTLLAAQAARNAETRNAVDAAQQAIRDFAVSPRHLGGLIMVTSSGEYGMAHNTSHMPWALLNDNGEVEVGIS